MQHSLDAMNAALRVLKALTEKRLPSESEIAALERFGGGPRPPDKDLDEYACDVIRKAIHHRAAARKIAGRP